MTSSEKASFSTRLKASGERPATVSKILMLFSLGLAILGCPLDRCSAQIALDPAEIRNLSEQAFIYGYPIVAGYGVMHQYAIDRSAAEYKAPFNTLYNTARVYTPADTAVVTPNSDTPYSFVWADLRAEPLVFHVPQIEDGRYYSVQLVDLYTFNFGYVGTRTTGNQAGTYMIAGPGWKGQKPDGVDQLYRCETDFCFAIFRTQLFGPEDLENVKQVQSGYHVETLSAFLGQQAPPAAPEIEWPKYDQATATTNPFRYLNFMLQFCPKTEATENEKVLREQFAKIGVEAGAPYSLDPLSEEERTAIKQGQEAALAKIKQQVENVGRSRSGWRLGSAAGDRHFFDGDWLLRAAGAMAGIYGNSQSEAFYPFLVQDSKGNKPNGRLHDYTMTFPAGGLPPVNAFWSVTMYDARTQYLVENPIDRYLVNSPMLDQMRKNDDGSLTIYIQRDSPGKEYASNWLPAPDGPIFLVMRLYWPKHESLDGTWNPPPLVPVSDNPKAAIQHHRRLRFGDKSLENIVRTDERYGHDDLFQGPRGWAYWNSLQNPRPIQNPNLWPDTQSTYFIGRFELPGGSRLTIPISFPRARYFQFALYKSQNNTFVSIGESLTGADIVPDHGSINPFRVGANRRASNRKCTLRIVAEDAPGAQTEREANTMYVGEDGGLFQSVIRIYLPDQGWDGAGWAPSSSSHCSNAFEYRGALADGTSLTKTDIVDRFARPIAGATEAPIAAEQWISLVNDSTNDPALDPETAPARAEPKWEKYWGIPYSILGAFKSPQARAKIPFGGAIDGGGDPSTQYFLTLLNRKFGPVYVMQGKMPSFPDTYAGADGKGRILMPEAQTQYWSLVSCEAAPSGQIVDGLADMQVPLDENRNYTIVYSRLEDRPKNATPENGVAWIEWSPRGEGLDHPHNREDFGMLMLRIMKTNPQWSQRPDLVTKPGMEEQVMGEYLPRGYYTDRSTFETSGPKIK
ncbi:DUF1254 domain-containing protein [Crateriforma spongiae]|uniref:DUF1254 domain-containing protein n=1 Tax=Crateriforma spongiae TaxID=2724528 RepID=UPI00197D22A2|nr:DUF1254 domain-containing protein [Crateriforma spongiae]